jgi:hypothetical protein
MPRTEARLKVTMWSNREFTALVMEDQRNYLKLTTQPGINLCGVVLITWGRWTTTAADVTVDGLRASFDRLEAARFIVVDYGTDELLVRTFIRHDGVWRNKKTRAGMFNQRQSIVSDKIRTALDAEIDRCRLAEDDPSSVADEEWDRAFPGGIPSEDTPLPSPPPSPSPSPLQLAHANIPSGSREGLSSVGRAAQEAYFGTIVEAS